MSEQGEGTRGRMRKVEHHPWCDTVRQSSEVSCRWSEAVGSDEGQRRQRRSHAN